MADIKKTADGVDNDSPYRALEADAAQMKIEEAQGELEPGEAMTECEMEVEADMLLQAALEEKLKAEARLEAALEEKRAAEAKLQAALDENREAEARLEGAAVIRPEVLLRSRSMARRSLPAHTGNLLNWNRKPQVRMKLTSRSARWPVRNGSFTKLSRRLISWSRFGKTVLQTAVTAARHTGRSAPEEAGAAPEEAERKMRGRE